MKCHKITVVLEYLIVLCNKKASRFLQYNTRIGCHALSVNSSVICLKAGETPLYLAADGAHEDCVLALLEADCDPNIPTTVCKKSLWKHQELKGLYQSISELIPQINLCFQCNLAFLIFAFRTGSVLSIWCVKRATCQW